MHCRAHFLTPFLPFIPRIHQLLHLVLEQPISAAAMLSVCGNQVTGKTFHTDKTENRGKQSREMIMTMMMIMMMMMIMGQRLGT